MLIFLLSCLIIYHGLWLYFAWLIYQGSNVPHFQYTPKNLPFISVILVVRDEAENLKRFFPLLLKQEYSGGYEIIVVLDRCSDNSYDILNNYTEHDNRIRLISIDYLPDGFSPKKIAIQNAIAVAQGDYFAFTDADCAVPTLWLRSIGRAFQAENQIVLGYSPYFKEKNWLNHLIQYETVRTATLYLALAAVGYPYMAVGRNMAYSRFFYDNTDKFSTHLGTLSGADDIIINQFGSKYKIGLLLEENNFVWSIPKKTWLEWYQQKTRHIGASKHYNLTSKLVIATLQLSFIGIYGGLFVLLFYKEWGIFVYSIYFFHIIANFYCLKLICEKFGSNELLSRFIFLDFIFALYQLLIVPSGFIKKGKWQKNKS